MLQRMKSGTVKLALLVSLSAFMATAGNADAVNIPIDSSHPQIRAAVDNVKNTPDVKDIMNNVRTTTMQQMAPNMPLAGAVEVKMRAAMESIIRPVQEPAMQNTLSNEIAPPRF